MPILGAADEFWRLRIMRVDDTGDLDLEWRDDVLYRAPNGTVLTEEPVWRVEAVRLDDDVAVMLGVFVTESDARDFLDSALEDLRELTAKQFAERYGCA